MYSPIPTSLEPTLEQQISETLVPNDGQFQDKQVDNTGFLQAIEEGLSSILSSTQIHKQARLELQTFFMDMKKQNLIRGVTEWTASEQKNFFAKVQSEVISVGAMAATQIRDKITWLIKDEIRREITDDEKSDYRLLDGDGNTMIPDMWGYEQFLDTSFVTNKETTVIPMDLRLTISEGETVADAKKKFAQYDGKYNALVFMDVNGHPIGVMKKDALQKYEDAGHVTLENVDYIEGVFGYYNTTSTEAKEIMQANGINILPIVDIYAGVLIGILTGATVAKKELQYYSTTSLTKLSLDCLGSHV